VPPASGGGTISFVGNPSTEDASDVGTTTETMTSTDMNGETTSTTTNTTTNIDGSTSTTTTTTLIGCVDVSPADDISDVSGLPCGSSSTSISETSTTKEIGKPIDIHHGYKGKTFSSIFQEHSAGWQDTELIGLIDSMNVNLSSSLPCYDFDLGSWGNVGSICFSTYAWIFDIIYYLNLFAAVLISRFIIFGGGGL